MDGEIRDLAAWLGLELVTTDLCLQRAPVQIGGCLTRAQVGARLAFGRDGVKVVEAGPGLGLCACCGSQAGTHKKGGKQTFHQCCFAAEVKAQNPVSARKL